MFIRMFIYKSTVHKTVKIPCSYAQKNPGLKMKLKLLSVRGLPVIYYYYLSYCLFVLLKKVMIISPLYYMTRGINKQKFPYLLCVDLVIWIALLDWLHYILSDKTGMVNDYFVKAARWQNETIIETGPPSLPTARIWN
jgi:hypothetical protein